MAAEMELPAAYYGKIDQRNPVVLAFDRDINSFTAVMRRAVSSNGPDNVSQAKGIKILVEISKKYKHRLPMSFYQKRMLNVADFLFGIKSYQLALWHGYSLHLLQFSSVKITEITDVDHFMACFFPEGFDTDQDIFAMKIHAMQGCALCIFEQEKKHSILSQKGLCKLLCVLNFYRIMMQAFQDHEHLCLQIYNGSIHIYSICRYLITMNRSAQALEYLLWACISVELSIPLMTSKNLSWMVMLYCAVCRCYYDIKAEVQAEEFARRALEKIDGLAKMEEQNEVPATRETQRAYREASIKLAAMLFKRGVFEGRKRPKSTLRFKPKSTLKDIPKAPWPRNATEQALMGLFDCSTAQFLGILEALWDSSKRPLDARMPNELELHDVIIELLSAGISIITENSSLRDSLALSPTSTLIELAITGENKVPVMSAVRFIKLLFQYKQSDTFAELCREMLQVLSSVEGQPYRKAEVELTLLYNFNSLLSSQKSHPRGDTMIDADKHKPHLQMSDEFTDLVDTLHKSICESPLEAQPDGDLVLDTVVFLWDKLKAVFQKEELQNLTHLKTIANYEKWLRCLSYLSDVAFFCNLATVDCVMMAEIVHTLALQLEGAAEHSDHKQHAAICESHSDGVKLSSFSLLEHGSSTELLKRVCSVVERGLESLAKGVVTMLPPDCSAITDFAFMQKFSPHPPPSSSLTSLTSTEEVAKEDENKRKKEEAEIRTESDIEVCQHTQSIHVYLLMKDFHHELNIIHHRASLKLLQQNAVVESNLLSWIKKNKGAKALFLIQKALVLHNNKESNKNSNTKTLLEEASTLIERAELEEKKLYFSTILKTLSETKESGMKEEEESPPPPPILLSRTDCSFTFAPAPYRLEGQVSWYQLCGREADSINLKVRLGDCSLPGTGIMVPVLSSKCVLRVEGLEPNQKYVFAVAAYNAQGKLLGSTIGATTFPLLASMPIPLLSTWAYLAQVAFQTEQCAIAKKACKELWSHFTYPKSGSQGAQDRLATTGLCVQTLQCSSSHLVRLFLKSIFTETEINIQQGSLYWESISHNGPFIWEKEARLAECERMLVAIDLALWLNDGDAAVQAVVGCYGLLAPLIFHQVICDKVVEVLKKCMIVLENSSVLQQNATGNTNESIMHMIACITYYLSKAYRVLQKSEMATVMIDCGRKLLQEGFDSQVQNARLALGVRKSKTDRCAITGKRISLQLKALHLKNKERITPEAVPIADNNILHPMSYHEDPTMLYDLVSNSPLRDAHQELSKLRRKAYFTEFAALLLQRAMEESNPDLVIKWGQSIFEYLSRRDEVMGLSRKCTDGSSQSNRRSSGQAAKGNESPQNKNSTSHSDSKKKLKQKIPCSMLRKVKTNREMQAVENLLTMMSSVVKHSKKRLQLRNMCCEERVWRAHLNYSIAQAHLALFYQSLDELHGEALQCRYSQLNPLCFSLAYSGVLMLKNAHQQLPKHEYPSEKDNCHSGLRDYVAAHKDKSKERTEDSVTEESCEEVEDPSLAAEQQTDISKLAATFLLDSLNKAALHLRRSMVLAHRGSHWTYLQYVCQTVWDQSCRITDLIQRAAQLEPLSPITADQLNTAFTPLLVLATDLIIDMLTRLGLWNLYDSELTDDELDEESSLHFSPSLDDSTQVDLRWVRTLVLHTLERLHENGKWESLAHFALVYNSLTRERYALVITPLLVHAQRRLHERISSFGGPPVPQPHHVKTKKAAGKEVTYRSYATCQLLSGWTPHPSQHPALHKKAAQTNLTFQNLVDLKGAEMKHAMSLVCVPLDVEDTLTCYREALEKRPYCLQVFQHSRSLGFQLLGYTQPCEFGFSMQSRHCQSSNQSHSASLANFSPVVIPTPNIQPCDLLEEDYSSSDALYRLPISPDHILTVTAAYSSSIKYLQANGHDSLRVLALHEMGNLQFYNGNTRAAYSFWSKAVDCALQNLDTVEKWDGVSFGADSLQQTLKQAGVWACLQAAVLVAKIAQYILTSDISQRTKCCLLSVHLFKCVLLCSLAQPQADLQYANHDIGDELLPGVDLFSELHRLHLGTTVASLNFVCFWLFTTGYNIMLLPMLALYQHFVGTVCRDVQRTVEAKILKIHALTELCLFTEAVKESVQLTQGIGILLPHGHYIAKDNLQPIKRFYSNKSLLDNAEALEELLNSELAPEVCKEYGSTLCLRSNLARVELILALSNTAHDPPVTESIKGKACENSSSEKPKHPEEVKHDDDGSFLQTKEDRQRMKFILLEGALSMLHTVEQQLPSQCCSKTEKLELEIEINFLKANLYLQQGNAALSTEMSVSSLMLLQTSPVITSKSKPGCQLTSSEHQSSKTGSKQGNQDCGESVSLDSDCPRAVEASERIGVPLWLRCRLALICSLTAHNHDTRSLFPDKNLNEEIAQMLLEGLDECARWGDLDTQALFMVKGAELEAQRGKTDESMELLQEAVSLLSGQTCLPPRSSVTLARATLLLSDLRGAQSTTLVELTQKLLIKQLCVFGENAVLDRGKICFPFSGPNNIYLPYLSLLDEATLQIGNICSLDTLEMPLSSQSSQSDSQRHSHLSSKEEKDPQDPILSLKISHTYSHSSPPCSDR
ncbi:cilia- and flagella-associated protein 54-like isoform X3 [Cheilinus undulatus]|uniref:cilia- and flagella-associated protein 54-like isoform X3 n=1 Tax=Cheilinus undulatus TaxID=241271 RepID=UPI001BD5B509|nr:cilia- and flagella-associated protein 54-like isoform X3 [Cheilinus undulatus]